MFLVDPLVPAPLWKIRLRLLTICYMLKIWLQRTWLVLDALQSKAIARNFIVSIRFSKKRKINGRLIFEKTLWFKNLLKIVTAIWARGISIIQASMIHFLEECVLIIADSSGSTIRIIMMIRFLELALKKTKQTNLLLALHFYRPESGMYKIDLSVNRISES